MRTRPSTFRAFRQDLIDLFRTEKPVRILVGCAMPTAPHGSDARGGWVLVTMVLPGQFFYCRHGFRCRRSVVGDGRALCAVANQTSSEPVGSSHVSHVISILVGVPHTSCPCSAICFPSPSPNQYLPLFQTDRSSPRNTHRVLQR